jgi:hypothetical protein
MMTHSLLRKALLAAAAASLFAALSLARLTPAPNGTRAALGARIVSYSPP